MSVMILLDEHLPVGWLSIGRLDPEIVYPAVMASLNPVRFVLLLSSGRGTEGSSFIYGLGL